MKLVFRFSSIILIAFATLYSCGSGGESDSDKVFICKGPYSTKYHYNSDCVGLNNCSTEIYSVSKSEAIEDGRKLCGHEK